MFPPSSPSRIRLANTTARDLARPSNTKPGQACRDAQDQQGPAAVAIGQPADEGSPDDLGQGVGGSDQADQDGRGLEGPRVVRQKREHQAHAEELDDDVHEHSCQRSAP